ncbi:hypothetical protein AMTR_s00234p00021690 [Amborella trichopoda]|uniref:Uncharacterized protein n=1 Tax=Amborella trichopoda TaxID=13333 RepID=W1NXU9_AMBTC|nr:hypothetical protein AMTR_s00234p00021690 [Amborella trichopoda]
MAASVVMRIREDEREKGPGDDGSRINVHAETRWGWHCKDRGSRTNLHVETRWGWGDRDDSSETNVLTKTRWVQVYRDNGSGTYAHPKTSRREKGESENGWGHRTATPG